MADEKKKVVPPQWLSRPIVHPDHVQDLETRAAVNEFHHQMPRHEAEQRAHEDYVREQREHAAAHHLAGMRAAQAAGNHEDARKHWALYDLHLRGLGKEAIGPVPPEIEHRLMAGDKPVYRFRAHRGDLYALHEPTLDQAPPQGEPIQKAEKPASTQPPPPKYARESKRTYGTCRSCQGKDFREDMHKFPGANAGLDEYECSTCFKKTELDKSEARHCKWRLGERRCQRMVHAEYCHDHVDHWANKIRQKEAPEPELEKADLPPTGTTHLAAPQLHNSVEGFMTGLRAHPQGSPERGRFITQHMNHGPFLQALKAHPQGAQLHSQLTSFLNSKANAGPTAAGVKTVVKSEAREAAVQLLEGFADLLKGQLLKFPGNSTPAVDQGKKADVIGKIWGPGQGENFDNSATISPQQLAQGRGHLLAAAGRLHRLGANRTPTPPEAGEIEQDLFPKSWQNAVEETVAAVPGREPLHVVQGESQTVPEAELPKILDQDYQDWLKQHDRIMGFAKKSKKPPKK